MFETRYAKFAFGGATMKNCASGEMQKYFVTEGINDPSQRHQSGL